MELREILFLIVGSSAFTAFISTILNNKSNQIRQKKDIADTAKDNADTILKEAEYADMLLNRYRQELASLQKKVSELEIKLTGMEGEINSLRERGGYWEKQYTEIKSDFNRIIKIYRENKCESTNCRVEKAAKKIVEDYEAKFGVIE